MGEQASLQFDLTYGDVSLHKLLQAYWFNMLRYTLNIISVYLKFGADNKRKVFGWKIKFLGKFFWSENGGM